MIDHTKYIANMAAVMAAYMAAVGEHHSQTHAPGVLNDCLLTNTLDEIRQHQRKLR